MSLSTLKLIYVGDDLYLRSGTAMSSIYTEDGRRFDWGFLSNALKQGQDVEIRQGTFAERQAVIDRFIANGGTLRENH